MTRHRSTVTKEKEEGNFYNVQDPALILNKYFCSFSRFELRAVHSPVVLTASQQLGVFKPGSGPVDVTERS